MALKSRPFVHGVATQNLASLLAFEEATGRFARSYTYFRSFGAKVNFDWEKSFATELVERGTTPVLTLQPRDPAGGVDQPAYSHRRIIAGDFDDLLNGWARALREVPGEVVVRIMHEGNGDWYPWCATVNGNTPASYIRAWRRMWRIFTYAGAGNVTWEWSMNKTYPGATPLESLYPGNGVVERVGFSGYNGGTILDRGGWRHFGEIFEASIAEVRRFTTKPIFIAETSAANGSAGDRAAWIAEMWQWLSDHREVAGMSWFDFPKDDVDWRLVTSPEAVAAYRKGAQAVVPARF